MTNKIWDNYIDIKLSDLNKQNLLRKLTAFKQNADTYIIHEGQRLLNLSSNNYLGLAGHPEIIKAMTQDLAHNGSSVASSRLVAGHSQEVFYLEHELAKFKQTEAALIFSSGYSANVGALSALLNRKDAVFSDRLNHASITDGIILSGAKHFRYRHLDMNHLESLLQKAVDKGVDKKLIITDTVFSMDGDIAPLRNIVYLKNKYNAALMIDEAHAGGVMGKEGQGLADALGLSDEVDIHMGTFSKAYGVYGGYIAGPSNWITYLINNSRSLIYTTGLPTSIISGIRASIKIVQNASDLRKSVHEKSNLVRNKLKNFGFDTGQSITPIIPIIIGEAQTALEFSKELKKNNILAVAIRPPTVPDNSSRIRMSIMASHTNEDLDKALQTIYKIGKELGVI